jgi:hypothetical protein
MIYLPGSRRIAIFALDGLRYSNVYYEGVRVGKVV